MTCSADFNLKSCQKSDFKLVQMASYVKVMISLTGQPDFTVLGISWKKKSLENTVPIKMYWDT